MASRASIFPAFIRAEYDPSAGGFARFEQDAVATADRAKRSFQSSFAEVGTFIQGALSRGLNSAGAVDLGVPQLQQAARESRAYAESMRETSRAATALAARTGDTSQATYLYLQALRAQVIEAESAARATEAQAVSYSRLQGELDRTASKVSTVTQAMRELYRGQIEAANADVFARRSQEIYTARYAPGLVRPRKSAADSAGVFAEAEEAERAWEQLELTLNQVSAASQRAERDLIDAGKAAVSAFGQSLSASERFEENLLSISNLTRNALAAPRNAAGALDLDVAGARQRAANLQAEAIAAREVATALERLAIAERDSSQEARLAVAAAQAEAVAREGAAREANQQADALDRLQREINQTKSGTQAVVTGNRNMTESSRASRFAMVMVGQQAQDMAVQLQMGVPAQQIFVQQVSQMGFALSQLQGRLGAVGRFLTGPWGTALFLGIAAIGYLTNALRGNREETEQAQSATELFGQSQSALGNLFDLNTGRLRSQNSVLGEHIELTRAQIQLDAIQLEMASQRHAMEAQRGRNRLTGLAQGTDPLLDEIGGRSAEAREVLDLFDEVERRRRRGDTDALRWGVERLNRIRQQGRGLRDEFRDFHNEDETGIADLLQLRTRSELEAELARRTQRSLEQNRLDPAFRERNRSGDRSREIESLREFGRNAADRLTGIAGDFADTPKIMDRARDAMREIDGLYRQIISKNERLRALTGQGLQNFDELAQSANAARQAIREGVVRQLTEDFADQPRLVGRVREALQGLEEAAREFGSGNAALMDQIREGARTALDALNRPYRDFLEDQLRAYETGELILRGREDEARAVQIIHRLEEQMGPLSEARRQSVLKTVIAIEDQARAIEVAHERQQLFLRAADEVRGSIADLLSNPQSGLRGIGDFFSSLSQIGNRLRGEVLTERLFGGIFRQLEDYVTGRDQVRRENESYAETIAKTRDELAGLGTANQNQEAVVNEVTAALQRLGIVVEETSDRMRAAAVEPANENVTGSQLFDDRGSSRLGGAFSGWTVGSVPGDPRDGGRRVHQGYDVFPGRDPRWLADSVVEVRNVRGHPTRSRQGITADIVFPDGSVWTAMHLAERPQTGTRRPGELIAVAGNTGNARTTPRHFHMEGRDAQGNRLDPRDYFRIGQDAVTGLSFSAEETAELLDALGRATERARTAMDELPAAAEGMEPDIKVTANPMERRLNPREFMEKITTGLASRVFGDRIGQAIGKYLPQALEGASYGRMASNMLLGRGGSSLGSQIGGAAGNILGKMVGKQIGGFFGQFGGPLGSAVGGILGGLAGNALRSTPRASSTIGFDSSGRLAVASTTGSSRYRDATSGAASSAVTTIERIAEALGATVLQGVGSVSIGIRDGKYRVDPTGRGITKTKKGAIDFGDDAEAAVRAATLDLIRDGIIGGIRASTQRLLQGAKDLDSALDKAVRFESVFTRLKEHLDPLGAALDALDKEFASLKRLFDEAGASAEEYAELEKLYGLDRKRVLEETTAAMTSALKSLLDDLTVNNDALSLRDRLALAKAKYDPLAADIAAGKTVDYDAFAEAARVFIDINRQIYGSQEGYFTALGEVTALTGKALAGVEGVISIGTNRPTPFGPGIGAGAADPSQPVVGAIERLGDYLGDRLGSELRAVNDNLGRLISLGGSPGAVVPPAGFIGLDKLHNF